MQNKVVVATNPLHFAYYRQQQPFPVIASTRGLFADYGTQLGFTDQVTLYDVANTPQAIMDAHKDPAARYLTWKPVDMQYRALGNTYAAVSRFEQKAHIRTLLTADLFPPFTIIPAHAIKELTYNSLAALLKTETLVVQLNESTGGRGTFIISDDNTFERLKGSLLEANQTIIVSAYISGTSRAVQCALFDGRAYSPPWWHRDLVGVAGICDVGSSTATQYCGAVLENVPDAYRTIVEELIAAVAAVLEQEQYYGVFGIDFVVDEAAKRVYLIEVNPRFTAVSHLYATAMRAAGYASDFLTAHTAGLLTNEVSSMTASFDMPRPLADSYFYLKLQNLSDTAVQLTDHCQMAVYDDGGRPVRFGWGVDALQSSSELVIIPETAHGIVRKRGERVYSVIGQGEPLQQGVLSPALLRQLHDYNDQFLQPMIT